MLLWISSVLVLLLLGLNGLNRERVSKGQPHLTLLILYGIAVGASTLLSINRVASLSAPLGLLTVGAGLVIAISIGTTLKDAEIDLLLIAGVVGALPVCMYGLLQIAGLDFFTWESNAISPLLSTLGRSNVVAAFLAVQLPIVLNLLPRFPNLRWQLLGTLGLILICLLLTRARAGWLAATVGVLILIIAPLIEKRNWQQVALQSIAILALSFTLFWGVDRLASPETVPIVGNSDQIEYSEIRAESVDRRVLIWRETLPLIPGAGLFGYGPATFTVPFQERVPMGSLFSGRDSLVTDPHNYFLKSFTELGVIPTLLFLIILVEIAFQAWTILWQGDQHVSLARWGILGGLAAWLVQAQFNPDTVIMTYLFWLLVGLWIASHVSKA